MTDIDERRDQYVPIDSQIAFKRTGQALLEKWGLEGVGAWMLLLAAVKREPVQGTFTYASDEEAWAKIGATPTGFTLGEFLTVLGRRKQISRRRHGRVTYVTVTNWGRWNLLYRRRQDAAAKRSSRNNKVSDTSRTPLVPVEDAFRHVSESEKQASGDARNPCKTGVSGTDIRRTENGHVQDTTRTEVEVEGEETRLRTRARTRGSAARLFECWQETWNSPRSILTEQRAKLVAARLKEGYEEQTLRAAILGSKRDDWPDRAKPLNHTFDLILRDAKHVESFAAMWLSPNGGGLRPGDPGFQPVTAAQRDEHARLLRAARTVA